MKTNTKTQIELVADLFDDLTPRTSNMAAKELNLTNKSVSARISNLVDLEILEKHSIGICLITGKKATYYKAIVWIKKALK